MPRPPTLLNPVWAIGFATVCIACAGKQTAPKPLTGMGPEMNTQESLAAAPIENVQAPITHLDRRDVVETVDAGFGSFLQDFETEPALTPEGTFEGFRIVRVHDRKKYEGLGIGPGDVVTSINGQPIERPAQAYAAFVSLKTASSLDVEYLRGGRMMRLSLPIVGEIEEPAAAGGEKKKPAPEGGAEKPNGETNPTP